jgi:hypothetical protein
MILPCQDPGSFGVEGEALDPLRLGLELGQHFDDLILLLSLSKTFHSQNSFKFHLILKSPIGTLDLNKIVLDFFDKMKLLKEMLVTL